MKAVAFLRACIFIFAVMLPGVLHAEPRMKLGAIISLTGDTANAGFACKNGIEMALDDLSEAQHNQLAVVVEDDSNIPRNTVS
ncbi:MAG TPA: hypothetical protein PLP17_10345, partial [Oligoflexia bacterium]|nr:hypothetical protein [Oligoflexia bacterium]